MRIIVIGGGAAGFFGAINCAPGNQVTILEKTRQLLTKVKISGGGRCNVTHFQDKKEILYSDGTCYVHEEFEPHQIDALKFTHPDTQVLAHPECKPSVIAKADYVGSTTGIFNHVQANPQNKFLLLTECGIASRLQVENPSLRLIGSCQLCKYMRSNSLGAILQALTAPLPNQTIQINSNTQEKALNCLNNMFKYAE